MGDMTTLSEAWAWCFRNGAHVSVKQEPEKQRGSVRIVVRDARRLIIVRRYWDLDDCLVENEKDPETAFIAAVQQIKGADESEPVPF